MVKTWPSESNRFNAFVGRRAAHTGFSSGTSQTANPAFELAAPNDGEPTDVSFALG